MIGSLEARMKSINKKDLLLEIITTDKLRFKDNGVKFVNILCMICCVRGNN